MGSWWVLIEPGEGVGVMVILIEPGEGGWGHGGF